jgi:hypothetical protein
VEAAMSKELGDTRRQPRQFDEGNLSTRYHPAGLHNAQ